MFQLPKKHDTLALSCWSRWSRWKTSQLSVTLTLGDNINFALPKARTNLRGIDTLRFDGQNLWQTLPKEFRESKTLLIFERNIKSITLDCSCKLCRTFTVNLRFL